MVVVLDADVASHTHRKCLPTPLATRLAEAVFCLTFVTWGELTRWMNIRSWGERNRQELAGWMNQCAVLGYDKEVAATWGRLAAAAQRCGHPVAPNDTWIAACCIVSGLPLATLNIKDFSGFAEHHGLRLFSLRSSAVRRRLN
jgi:predicted nucleic acid-binding protein